MRELTKSILSFSWAMSLFGIQQATNLSSPEKMVKAFESITETTKGQFPDVLKTAFNAGDKLQQSTVDLSLGMLTGETFNPNKWIRMASDTAKQSAEVVTKGVQDVTAAVRQTGPTATAPGASAGPESGPRTADGSTASQRQGWGPRPV